MSKITVTEHPCTEHARGAPCGPTWFQFTAHNHTIGACSTIESETGEGLARGYIAVHGPCTGKVRTDTKTRQKILELVDVDGQVVKQQTLDPTSDQ